MSFFSKTLKKAFGKKVGKFLSNPLRRIQRSHKFGKLGHSILPSSSKNNLLTSAYSSVLNRLSKSAIKLASRMSASPAVSSASGLVSSMPSVSSQRLDYRYRRLKDLV